MRRRQRVASQNGRGRRPFGRRPLTFASWPVSRVLCGGGCPPRDGHSSWTPVARRLALPTRTAGPETGLRFYPRAAPIRYCSRWGLPCRTCCQIRGGLLPHPFTLTRPAHRRSGGLLSVALSLGSPPPDVIRHRVSMEPGLSSPAAFRHLSERPSGQLTDLQMAARQPPVKFRTDQRSAMTCRQ